MGAGCQIECVTAADAVEPNPSYLTWRNGNVHTSETQSEIKNITRPDL